MGDEEAPKSREERITKGEGQDVARRREEAGTRGEEGEERTVKLLGGMESRE